MSIPKPLLLLIPLIFLAQPALADYDPTISLEYVYASALAYCDTNSIQSWSCGEVCQNLTGYQVQLVQTFNIASEQSLVLVLLTHPASKRFLTIFRGTVGAVELIVEIMQGNGIPFDLFNISNALVDDYFYIHYTQQLRPVVTEQLQKAYASFPDYQYVFTGHSLGGAFATLGAFDMISSNVIPKSQVIVYNYGSPRVGNQVLSQAIEAAVPEIYRVVHWRDIVPHVPPCKVSGNACVPSSFEGESEADSILWPAWHVTTEVFYDEKCSSYVICKGEEDPTCSDQFSLTQTLVMEHLKYLNVSMVCGSITAYGKNGLEMNEAVVSEEMKQAVEDSIMWKSLLAI